MATKERKIIELEEGWDLIKRGIHKVVNLLEGVPDEQQFSCEEYMVLYTTIYNMCTQKPPQDYSKELYARYGVSLQDYINCVVLPSIRDKHDEFMLRELVKSWDNVKVLIRWLSNFFRYLDRIYIPKRCLPSLHAVGITCFRDLVYQEVKHNAKDVICVLIHKEREGKQIDRALVRNAVQIFVEVGMGAMEAYETGFEAFLLRDTVEYYRRKAFSWIEDYSSHGYLLKVEECLKHEQDQVGFFLHGSSEQKLVEKVLYELLARYEEQLLEDEDSGCRTLLRNDKVEDLSRLYKLFCKITSGLDRMANIFQKHVMDEGMALVSQSTDAARDKKAEKKERDVIDASGLAVVRDIIELYHNYLHYVGECFRFNALFQKALKEAFEVVCNSMGDGSISTAAELFASFCDSLLKKGRREKFSIEATEDTLDKALKLVPYVTENDLFEEFYRKKLGRRLLFHKSVINNEQERSMLLKLKQQHGVQFTSKMEGMVTDLCLSRENESSFESYLSENVGSHPGIDLTVTVLTTGCWPSYASSDLALPAEMVRCLRAFQEFYQTKMKHRKLTWIYSLGMCNVVGYFQQKAVELVVTTYQAALLLLFNSADRLSYSKIKTLLRLEDGETIKRLLHSLSCAKFRILSKDPESTTIHVKDSFEFNARFSSRLRRIRIPLPALDDKNKVFQDVDRKRRYAIDASVVRIMKSRKVLRYEHLVSECLEQLQPIFKPDVIIIKHRIEDLIERDYLERRDDNPSEIRYLA